jgi:hypothetical protein
VQRGHVKMLYSVLFDDWGQAIKGKSLLNI